MRRHIATSPAACQLATSMRVTLAPTVGHRHLWRMKALPFPSRAALTALALALAFLLAACESPVTTYRLASEPGGYGITEHQIDARDWEVSFSGNRFTTREQVENSALYRAAEIAAGAGADGFLVLKEVVDHKERYNEPFYGPYGYPYVAYGYHRYAHLLVPMRPYYEAPGELYTVTLRVRLFSGSPPPNLGTPYNAQELLANLKSKIAPLPKSG